MVEHVGWVLARPETFIDDYGIQVILKAIVHEIRGDGRDLHDLLGCGNGCGSCDVFVEVMRTCL